MRYLLLLCLLVMTFTVPLAAQADCGLESRLSIGSFGVVTPGEPNRIRAIASRQGELISYLEGGKAFEVVGDSLCAEGLTWIEVKYTTRDGFSQGWTAESDDETYFLDPVEDTVIAGYGVTAILPEGIADSAEITFHEKKPEIDGDWTLPEYVEISFTGYEDNGDNNSEHGTISIYRTDVIPVSDNYNMWEGGFRHIVDELAVMLEERPDLQDYEPIYKRLPLFDVASSTNILAYRDYLPFANGDGYHALVSSGQAIFEPTNDSLHYTYVGLTNDGQYFVHVDLPINAAELPGEAVPPVDLVSDEMREYVLRNGAFFDALDPESFTPPLPLIDSLVSSLYIGD